jgi:O-antigen/teichoic acid export membrane protein
MSFYIERIARLAKEGGWIVAGQIATIVGSLVLIRVLTEYLTPLEYGELALSFTIALLINQVAIGGLGNGVLRFYSIAKEKEDVYNYLIASKQLFYKVISGLILVVVLVVIILYLLKLTHWLPLFFMAIVFAIVSGVVGIFSNIQTAARQRMLVAFHSSLDAWLKIVLALGLMLWLGHDSVVVLLGYTISALVIIASQFFSLRRTLFHSLTSSNKKSNWQHKIWSQSWPFSVFGLFTWAQQASDRWVLQIYSSISDVGVYAVVYQLGFVPIGILTGIGVTFITPILFNMSGDSEDASRNLNVHRIVMYITFTSLTLTLIFFILAGAFHQYIFQILVAAEYREMSYLLKWLILAGGLFATGQVLAVKIMSDLQSKTMVKVKIVTSLIGVTLNYIGAMKFGVLGVAYAMVITSLIYTLWMYVLVNRKTTLL